MNPTPAAPTVGSQTFCSADSPTVGSLPQGGGSYKWYTASTGGSALPGSTALSTATYYVSQTSAQGCESARTQVSVTVNPTPSAPSASAQSFCSADNPKVSNLAATGTNVKWYSAATGGSALAGTTALTTGTYYVSQTSAQGCQSARTAVTVTVNTNPTCSITGSDTVCPNSTTSYTAPAGMDTYAWSVSGNGTISGSSTGASVSVISATNCPGSFTLSLTVTKAGCSSTCTKPVTVADTTVPTVMITGPASGSVYPAGTTVTFTGSFTDTCGGPHTAVWSLDNTTVNGTVNEGTGSVTASYKFTAAGVYNVTLTVTDLCGNAMPADKVNNDLKAMVIIYDPNAGFVTGGGWFMSPIVTGMQYMNVSGKANFGFVSKYKAGANTPTGETEFQFQEGNLNFHSTTYSWLVVSGSLAQYKGTGTINGTGNYSFILTARDGDINNSGAVDGIRMKITDGSNAVYDNKMGADDTMSSGNTQDLNGGSIVIHTK